MYHEKALIKAHIVSFFVEISVIDFMLAMAASYDFEKLIFYQF